MVSLQLSAVSVCLVAIALYYFSKTPGITSVVTDHINTTYDYIVVGAGTAGPVVAARLSEDPDVSVLLLEAGGDYTEREDYHVPLLYKNLQLSSADWMYYTVPQSNSSLAIENRRSFWSKGKLLGGSNIFNALQYARGSRHDYDEWEKMGGEGWGYEDILPYFLKSEDMKIESLKSSKYHNTGGEIAISSAVVTPLSNVLMQAGKEMGYKEVDNNGETQEGFGYTQILVRDGVRSSSALEFLSRARGRDNLHVSIYSFVTKVAVENKKAVGVYVIMDGKKRFIKANKEVILSAGAINSPQLLMLSGIGPRKHLESAGIPVIADLPVGENLQEHLILVVKSKLNKELGLSSSKVNSWKTRLQYQLFGSGILASNGNEVTAFMCTEDGHDEDCAADIQFMIGSDYCTQHRNIYHIEKDVLSQICSGHDAPGFTVAISHLDPRSVGTIKLQSADPFDHPLIDPAYLTNKHDIDVYVRGIRLWEQYIMTPTLQELGANFDDVKLTRCSKYEFRSDEYWECFVRHLAVTCYHPAGTCKMGKASDKTAVVDSSLRVIGISGLRVVDASIMPNVPSGNINAPINMVAEKAADMIREKDTVADIRKQLLYAKT